MNWHNVLLVGYWLRSPAPAEGVVLALSVIFFLALVAIGIVGLLLRIKSTDTLQREIYRRVANWSLTMGVLALLWMFFRQERVVVLNARIWILCWVIGFGYWGARLLRYYVKRVPEIRSLQAARELRNKYLPKK